MPIPGGSDASPEDREKPIIGVCLSGGGFRASFYALGVLRYLAEAGLLVRTRVVSSISGGSMAAAVLADRWGKIAARGYTLAAFLDEVDVPFREVVTEKNLRNVWLRRWLRRPWRDRGVVQGTVLADHLYETRLVRDLPDGLQVVITSTDLATGRAFRICRDFVGSYDFDYIDTPGDLELGSAVAASAAFPIVFPPVHLRTDGWPLADAPPTLSLTDGGVYDNLGLEWFQGWDSVPRPAQAIRPDFLVVADASGAFQPTRKRIGGLRALGRARSIQYRQTLALRRRWLIGEFRRDEDRRWDGIYVAATHDPRLYKDRNDQPIRPAYYDGALPSELVGRDGPVARLRTDLDRFLLEEAIVVSYHGYWCTHAAMATYHPGLAVESPKWRQLADLTAKETAAFRFILDCGRKRLGPRRYWG